MLSCAHSFYKQDLCYLDQELVSYHLITPVPSRSNQKTPIAVECGACWVSGLLLCLRLQFPTKPDLNVDVLASPVKFKASVRTATVLMHLRKFWLHWLWQRIMSGFENCKNIWGISNPFSSYKVSFQENLTVLKKTWSLLNFNRVNKKINRQTYPSC